MIQVFWDIMLYHCKCFPIFKGQAQIQGNSLSPSGISDLCGTVAGMVTLRPLQYSSQYGHAEGQHVNIGRDTPSFCPTLLVLDVNPVTKFLPHTLQHLAVNSSDCLHDPLSQLW
jgi:hypothetical protein